MGGKRAAGSPASATTPAITVTMAMTIATMGRRMKKADMDGLPLSRPSLLGDGRRGGSGRSRLGLHQRPVGDLLQPFDDDPFACAETGGDNPLAADARADVHFPYLHIVLGRHHGDGEVPLKLAHRGLRNG